MTVPTIDSLPTPPSTSDPTNFSSRADAFLAALVTFQSQANTMATYIDALLAGASSVGNATSLLGKTWAQEAAKSSGLGYQFAYRDDTSSGTTAGYYGGVISSSGSKSIVASGTIALTNNTTNYVERTEAGVVSTNTSGYTSTKIPMFRAVTSGGAITSVTDDRQSNVVGELKSLGLVTASGLNLGGSTLSSYIESTFVPAVTLVGGSGNVVPVYSTNTGRATRIGNRAFCEVLLTGDGGNEGAGTGAINIGLPYTSGASAPASGIYCGYAFNNATVYLLVGTIGAGGGTIALSYMPSLTGFSSLAGSLQDNATRAIRLNFSYEVAP